MVARDNRMTDVALMSAVAGDDFNRGLRAHCYGFAAMTWFISPQRFMGFTLIVLIVLMRRDFRSRTLSVLSE